MQWYRRDGFRIPGSRKRVNTEGHRVFSPLVRSMEAAFLQPHRVPLLISDWLEFSHMAMPTLREAENHLLLPEANSGAKMLGKVETWVLVPPWAALGTPPGSVCLWRPGRKREGRDGSRWGQAVSEQNPQRTRSSEKDELARKEDVEGIPMSMACFVARSVHSPPLVTVTLLPPFPDD